MLLGLVEKLLTVSEFRVGQPLELRQTVRVGDVRLVRKNDLISEVCKVEITFFRRAAVVLSAFTRDAAPHWPAEKVYHDLDADVLSAFFPVVVLVAGVQEHWHSVEAQ
jgi:hypothetical protein